MVAALLHRHVVFGAAHHEDGFDTRAAFQGLVDRRFERQHAAAPEAAVRRNNRFSFRVNNALSQRSGAEAAEHHAVRRADAGTGEHRHRRLGNHRHVDSDPVTLGDALTFKSVGELRHLAQHVVIGQGALVSGLTLPVKRDLIPPAQLHLIVQRVIGGVGLSSYKPLHKGLIPLLHRVPGFEPVKFIGDAAPKGIRVVQGLLIEAFVLL